jgi:hypothetical protein
MREVGSFAEITEGHSLLARDGAIPNVAFGMSI